MKKILFLLIFISTVLFASKIDTEKEIYGSIIHAIFPNRQTVYVWSDDKTTSFLDDISGVKMLDNVDNADILILSNFSKNAFLAGKIVFVRKYYLLKKYKDFAVGGFYWQKGRPNILFLKQNLEKFDIKLPNGLESFVEDEL